MKKTLTVLVDSREQKPLLFPKRIAYHHLDSIAGHKGPKIFRIRKVKTSLDAGDYTIKGYESLVRVERKQDLRELANNTIGTDHSRFERAMAKLSYACTWPYLYIEQSAPTFWTENETERVPYEQALDKVLWLCQRLGIIFVSFGRKSVQVGSRQRMGEFIVRLMLSHIYEKETTGRTA